ncbi:hypothetical protein AC629_39195 [Bradyrhizobium sp. NAS80.1]|nr:hypothetical protein AC629_39195 [Bradyrhizobium sp. NAS80.1]
MKLRKEEKSLSAALVIDLGPLSPQTQGWICNDPIFKVANHIQYSQAETRTPIQEAKEQDRKRFFFRWWALRAGFNWIG